MARRKKTEVSNDVESPEPGEQLELIDTKPENHKEILKAARQYQSAKILRLEALEDEVGKKMKLLELIHNSGLQPKPDGTIMYRCDNLTIIVKPTKENISVKELGQEDETDD